MKEDFLHFLWQRKLFDFKNLKTVEGEFVTVLKVGGHNKNTGPDFLNAHLKIEEQLWVGTVEIHIKSSDWYLHQHEVDENYDAVILHVVWEHDTVVYMKNNKPLPTLVLKDFVVTTVLKNYYNLFSKKLHWIACENQIASINSFRMYNWLERLYFERLENKANLINALLEKSYNNFEAVLFQLLAKNFGLKINGEAFLSMAQSFDFSVLRKVRFNEDVLTALFFGQAGFLEEHIENEYFFSLKKEYNYLQHKYNLKPVVSNFQFFRMRPSNFPTIRLAQLVALYHKYSGLFDNLMRLEKLDSFYNYFSVTVSKFWQTQYTFETTSKKSSKKLTKNFIDLVLINTIVPLKFVWLKYKGKREYDGLLALLKEIKPEQNSIIDKFSSLKIKAKNAFETQALLELKAKYCEPKNCLKCAIGNQLLQR